MKARKKILTCEHIPKLFCVDVCMPVDMVGLQVESLLRSSRGWKEDQNDHVLDMLQLSKTMATMIPISAVIIVMGDVNKMKKELQWRKV